MIFVTDLLVVLLFLLVAGTFITLAGLEYTLNKRPKTPRGLPIEFIKATPLEEYQQRRMIENYMKAEGDTL